MIKSISLLKKQKKCRIGILALQGNVREHARMLTMIGAEPVHVKLPEDLNNIHGLIIPGGESTTIRKLMKQYKLDTEIKKRHSEGLPIYGTCAGSILLAKEIIGENETNLDLIDVTMKRNAYGRQRESFEQQLHIDTIGQFNGIFIRAPTVQHVHNGATVLAKHDNKPVMIREKDILITTFHPELTGDTRIHQYFLDMVKEYEHIRDMQLDIEDGKNKF